MTIRKIGFSPRAQRVLVEEAHKRDKVAETQAERRLRIAEARETVRRNLASGWR